MTCALCGGASNPHVLAEASWLARELLDSIERERPGWRRESGACPSCVQAALLRALLARGEGEFHEGRRAALGVLPSPLRMRADPRYRGLGVTLALIDSGFHPHPDLTQPRNRIRAWADASAEPVRFGFFGPDENPRWPGCDDAAGPKWHGLMTSAVAAGNGRLSHGLYRGPASEADLILVEVLQKNGRITNTGIARALDWLGGIGSPAGPRAVSLAVGGDPLVRGEEDRVHLAIAALVKSGVTVIAAAGNDGRRGLVPPASSSSALTVGGIDDRNAIDHSATRLCRHNYCRTTRGARKPELVAPGVWVAAPLLPRTSKAAEAAELFARLAGGEAGAEAPIVAKKYLTPHYHHVDGTSVAASLAAGVVACMLEANPELTPRLVRRILKAASRPIHGAAAARQGAGALDAGRAVTLALASRGRPRGGSAPRRRTGG